MEKQQFKAESKRLLDLMINSIYTHKEIFLRELISNASDAIDKLYYLSLTDDNIKCNRDNLEINIIKDKEKRILTISDNGIGMNQEDLEENLGTIAKSGSLAFKKAMEENKDIDIIGQFGVGFYSAFMIAKNITVLTKKANEEKGYMWQSSGEDGYTITECEKDTNGTTIILELKENTEDENYDEYLDEYKLKELIKKYSDYVRYPIKMMVEKQVKKEDSDEYETKEEIATINSMIPLWKRNKSEITEKDYNEFYKNKFYEYEDPIKTIHFDVEGNTSFSALLFIPAKAPFNYYSKDFEKGLKLYSRSVFIMDKASELLPEHFRFVKGLVDSQDLSLNISREMLQHDRQLKIISNRIEKKIKDELLKMLNNDRENYEKFYQQFGLQLKYGVYSDFGMHKELLQDLLMFYSSSEKKLVTLKEYVSRMKEKQEHIYFASGESYEKIDLLPQCELVKDKGYEILYLVDDVDEFCLQVLNQYDSKSFKSVNQGDLELEDEETKKEIEQTTEDNKDLMTALKESLKDDVADVKISTRLKTHPVCLTSTEGISLEMEKVLNQMPNGEKVKAQKVLEINHNHPLFAALQKVYATNKEEIKNYADILYNQALLIEGLPIENPLDFSNKLCDLIVKANR